MTTGRKEVEPLIEKCAAVIVRKRRLLVVRKVCTDVFISPGGKIIAGESRESCLRRELYEELGVDLVAARYFGTFVNPSALEAGSVTIHAFVCDVSGEIAPRSEIEEFAWVAGCRCNPGLRIGSVFADYVIPRLVSEGVIDA